MEIFTQIETWLLAKMTVLLKMKENIYLMWLSVKETATDELTTMPPY